MRSYHVCSQLSFILVVDPLMLRRGSAAVATIGVVP
jgi:hypothetical protein